MFSFKRFFAIFYSRNKEFWRDRATLSWNLAFPILLIFGFSFIFSGEGKGQLKIGLIEGTDEPGTQVPVELKTLKYTDFVFYSEQELALKKVSQHQIDLLVDWTQQKYWANESSPKAYLAESLLFRVAPNLRREVIIGDAITYLDWVVPGILGMNIMFSCLFGVGYVIVRYRKNGVLKRLQATPVTAFEFISAQIASRLMIVALVSSVIFFGTWQILGFKVVGSMFSLLIILCLGTISLIALGLLVASRSESEELTGGLLNMASWPMMFLSGVWFSLEGAPEIVTQIAQLLPLTHLVDAARKVMTEGATLIDVSYNIIAMLAMSITFFIISALTFSWGKNR